MAYKSTDNQLKHPDNVPVKHSCDFGDPYLKFKGLIVAKMMGTDFNSVVKLALDWYIQEVQRKRKVEFDGLLKTYWTPGKKR